MKTSRTILIAAALATGLIATQLPAQNFVTNNGVIIGSPGNPASVDGNFAPAPPGGRIPQMPPAGNRGLQTNSPWNTRTNSPWNTRTNVPGNAATNGNMFPGSNTVHRVPISSNIPGTSLQPPDSSLPPMTNAPGRANQVIQPGTVPKSPPASPSAPSAPPLRK